MVLVKLLNFLGHHRLELVAFFVGLVILSFELTATRVTAPYIGTTIYVWTSVIGIILAAIALGNAVGGIVADKRQRRHDVVILLLIAAAILAIVTITKDSLLRNIAALPLSNDLQAPLISLLLFAPPTFVLGLVIPYLSRLNITSVATSGQRVSRIDAAGTIGSLTGTFLTGYILFAFIGTRYILLLLALLLILASFIIEHRYLQHLRIVGVVAVLILLSAAPAPLIGGLVAEKDTAYSRVLIRDAPYAGGTIRALQTDSGAIQSAVFTDGRKLPALGYIRGFTYAAKLRPEAEKVLVIGGGGFTLPAYFAGQAKPPRVDTVEIDSGLEALSTRYLNYKKVASNRIINADGITFLNSNNQVYDLVYIDAFSSLVPPFQLFTKEASERLRVTAGQAGLVVINVISPSSEGQRPLLDAIEATLETSFTHINAYQVSPELEPNELQNILVFATNTPVEEAMLQKTGASIPEFARMLSNEIDFSSSSGQILTNDFAPVDRLVHDSTGWRKQ